MLFIFYFYANLSQKISFAKSFIIYFFLITKCIKNGLKNLKSVVLFY